MVIYKIFVSDGFLFVCFPDGQLIPYQYGCTVVASQSKKWYGMVELSILVGSIGDSEWPPCSWDDSEQKVLYKGRPIEGQVGASIEMQSTGAHIVTFWLPCKLSDTVDKPEIPNSYKRFIKNDTTPQPTEFKKPTPVIR